MTRKQAPKPHPDFFWSMSGGINSVSAFLLTKDIAQNYSKRPVMLYFDTRIGLPVNRIWLEELADAYSEQLWTLRTFEKFEEWVARDGAPGPGAHAPVQNELKGRQASKINTLADNPVHIIGLSAYESDHRAGLSKVVEKPRHVEVYPAHRLSKDEQVRIILQHEECPINPAWVWNHFTDCGCMANGDPSELDRVEERFPWFGQRMREIEEAADTDGVKGTLGWGGLSAEEQRAREQGQQQLTLCGEDCQRKTVTPDAEEALVAVADGMARPRAIEKFLDAGTEVKAGV